MTGESEPWSENDAHVRPLNDAIEHTFRGCVCGPSHELVITESGGDAWLYVHHSLDGREVDMIVERPGDPS